MLKKDRVEQNKQSGIAAPPSDHEKQYELLANSTNEISRSLVYVVDKLEENDAPLLEDDLELCRKWSREVGRYSFGWHLKWVE